MAKHSGRIVFAAALFSLVAAGFEPASAASSASPVTLRGAGTASATPADRDGASASSSIVLRGSTLPPTPSFAGFPCPPGYSYDPDTGCIVSGAGPSYGAEPEWWYWPYDLGGRRLFRPHRRAAGGLAHRFSRGPGFHGMPVAHGFGGGRR